MQRRRRERISHSYLLNGVQDGNVVPQHPVDVLQACVGSKLEAFANACLPPHSLVQLVPHTHSLGWCFSRVQTTRKGTQLRRGFEVFQ
jgi:hypothetical protein